MALTTDPIIVENYEDSPHSSNFSSEERTAVLQELNNILASQPFRNSSRSKQFLSHVVQHKLKGRCDLLKERTIGTEIFHRKVGYATGDDPVVRVQAGEVRRRLEQYYHAAGRFGVRIELPLGSYAPEFQWNPSAPEAELKAVSVPKTGQRLRWAVGGLVVVLMLGVAITGYRSVRKPPQSALDQFWAPVLSAEQPVLVCLAKPVSYRPSLALYKKYAKSHPGAFQSEVERFNQPLPLDRHEKMEWGDMVSFTDYGVAMGDVYAATRLSALFASLNKTSQVRIGQNYSFEDLRNSPAVVIGAFNNRWTLQMTANLHFAFAEHDGQFRIQEQGAPGKVRSWAIGPNGEIDEDFAIVTRLLDSKTGQAVVAVAGLGANGTQAAGELISRADYLEEAFRTAPVGWQKKNLQILLKTTVTDFVAGPPRVVATYFW
jgi:hypothetical protein